MAEWQPGAQLPWMVRVVIKAGFVKTRKQAELFLLGFAALGILFTLWSFFSTDHVETRPEDDPNYDPTLVR